MVDFPVCPSSERTMSVLSPFCRGIVKIGRFYRKVVSISLFAETLPKLKNCTAQSLRPSGPAPFTQGSLCSVPFSTRTPLPKQPYKFQFLSMLSKTDRPKKIFYFSLDKTGSVGYNTEVPTDD